MMEESSSKQKPVSAGRESLDKPSVHRSFKPKIDMKTCEKNYDCVVFCPRNAIEVGKNEFPSISYDACDGCLICLRVCPSTAIREDRE